MRTIQWTDRMTTLLIELYPVETTFHTAMALGISETLVKQKARKLGLKSRQDEMDGACRLYPQAFPLQVIHANGPRFGDKPVECM